MKTSRFICNVELIAQSSDTLNMRISRVYPTNRIDQLKLLGDSESGQYTLIAHP